MSNIMSGINWLDIAFILVLLGMLYKGTRSGVGSQLLSLAWWFVLIFCAFTYYKFVSRQVFGLMIQNWARALSFFSIAAALFVIIIVLSRMFKSGGDAKMALVERLGGGIVAAAGTCLLFGIVGIQFILMPVSTVQESVTKSKSAMIFVEVDAGIYSWMTGQFKFTEKQERAKVIESFFESAKNVK